MKIFTEIRYFSSVILRDMSFFGSYVCVVVTFLLFLVLNQIQFAKTYFIGVVILTLIEIMIKLFYKNKRPDFKSIHPYSAFQKFEEGSSFPSGHSGKAAFFTSLIHIFYGNLALTGLFTFTTIYVGISRIFLKRHFVLDILGGFVLGIAIAILTTHLF